MNALYQNLKNQIADLVSYNKTATAIVAGISFVLGAIIF